MLYRKDASLRHTLDDWHDSTLLNSRWALETVGVDSAEELWLEVHGIEGVDGLVIVRLDLSCWPKSAQIQIYRSA